MLSPSWNSLFAAGSLVLGLVIFTPQAVAQSPTAVVSLIDDKDWQNANTCIQSCLWYNGGSGRGGASPDAEDLGKAIGCGQGATNGCYCATSLAASATNFISSYISNSCAPTDTVQLSDALSIYNRYCGTANALAQDAATTLLTTTKDLSSSNSNSATPTDGYRTGIVYADPSTPTSKQQVAFSDPGLSAASKVALGVGLGLGLAVVLFLCSIFFCLWRKGRRDSEPSTAVVEAHHPKD